MKLTWSHILILNVIAQKGHSYQKHKVRTKQANGMS
jgi:hypothetical protein